MSSFLARRAWAVIALIALFTAGCTNYLTPGGVKVGNLSAADGDIEAALKREPASPFPARIAIARVQVTGYSARGNSCYGRGQYCVVTTRDIETEADFERIQRLPMVGGLATMSRILLPEQLSSIRDLRLAAANLKTDMVLIYSLDTRFSIDSTDIGPLALISLGYLPNKRAMVSTTASAALFDVRTGFIYGVAESTANDQQRSTMWSTEAAIDSARQRTEAESFKKLIAEFEKLWKGIVELQAAKK
jgi:hypothetical protein